MTTMPPAPIEPRLLADYRRYTVGVYGHDQDGGLSYCLAVAAQSTVREGPPRIPREREVSPWPTLVAGCLLGLGGIIWGVGLVTIIRWLFGA